MVGAMKPRTLVTACCAIALGGLSACQSGLGPLDRAAEYPFAAKQEKTLDIQVVRSGTRVSMTNTTATNFGPSRLWLNRRFSFPIAKWEIGETLDLPLKDFLDEFGERFRPGGFFAAEAPDKIVHAQIEVPSPTSEGGARMLGLIVVPATD